MDLDLWTVLVVFGLTAAALLLTGPGLWSEKWGWGWFRKKKQPGEEQGRGGSGPKGGRSP